MIGEIIIVLLGVGLFIWVAVRILDDNVDLRGENAKRNRK